MWQRRSPPYSLHLLLHPNLGRFDKRKVQVGSKGTDPAPLDYPNQADQGKILVWE